MVSRFFGKIFGIGLCTAFVICCGSHAHARLTAEEEAAFIESVRAECERQGLSWKPGKKAFLEP